jgi:hypothetical protein
MHLGGESMLECWEEEGGRVLVVGALNIWRRKTCLGGGSMLECWEDGFFEWRVHAGMMREDEFL